METNRDVKLRPKAECLSQWNSGTEVIYKCPNCGTSFRVYGNKEKYCHECGQAIDWNVKLKVSDEFAKIYHNEYGHKLKEQVRLMDILDSNNESDAHKHEVDQPTQLTMFDELCTHF